MIDFDIDAIANSVESAAGAFSSTLARPRAPDCTSAPLRTTANEIAGMCCAVICDVT